MTFIAKVKAKKGQLQIKISKKKYQSCHGTDPSSKERPLLAYLKVQNAKNRLKVGAQITLNSKLSTLRVK
jgi:hypothetical protein